MDPKEVHEAYYYGTIGFGETKSFKSLKHSLVKITFIECLAQIEDGKIVEFDKRLPYCFISGTDIFTDETLAIAVINKVDFGNAWKIDEDYSEGSYDCYLEYKPLRFLSKQFPQFEFLIYKKGADPSISLPVTRLKRFPDF